MKCCEKCADHEDCSIEGELLSAIKLNEKHLNMTAILKAVKEMDGHICIQFKEADNE